MLTTRVWRSAGHLRRSLGRGLFTSKTEEQAAAVTASFLPEEIINGCISLRESVQALNDKFKGPLEKNSQKNTILPFVFLLGNHSSGKSSFINYVCQRKIQTAGVAPTDDMFTVIVPGPADVDRDGPSFVGDPDMGFSALRSFGPQLIHHTRLKVRSSLAIKNFMMVDTPGMIDSPMVRDQYGKSRYAVMNRGYDFEKVCRWYAERADVILLFFDPDKPGTTGETLSILTNSLVGVEHKLHIILNKADQFKKIHDFARAYGSLCWNLSKVIQRKDLPRIYTMCLPKSYQIQQMEMSDANGSSLGKGLSDLEETREEVVLEVLNAPKRRVDNEISRLTDSVALLQMHLAIVDDLTKQQQSFAFRTRLTLSALLSTSVLAPAGLLYLGLPFEAVGATTAVGLLGSAGYFWWMNSQLGSLASRLVTEENVEATFKRLYSRRLADQDEAVTALWSRVQAHLHLNLSAADLRGIDKVRTSDFKQLEQIVEVDIPTLRRKAAPAFNRKLA